MLKPRYAMELDSSELLKRFVAADVGVGFISRVQCPGRCEGRVLAAIPISDAQIRRDLALVFRKDKALSRAALAFIDIAVKIKTVDTALARHSCDAPTKSSQMPSQQPAPRLRFRLRLFAPVLIGFLLSSLIMAQSTPHKAQKHSAVPSSSSSSSSSWKLTAVKVTGSQRYRPDAVIAASGLQIGQVVTKEDFERASQRLGRTGAFDNVTYNFRYSSEGAQLELHVADSGQWAPVRFENFVWFPDKELRATLHQQVPLFEGLLPLSGDLLQQVSDALQVLLLERKIAGHADYIRAGPEDGPLNAIVFSVTGPNIRIRSVAFAGAEAGELPLLEALGKQLIGREYSQSLLLVQAEKTFLPVYLARGYLKAVFSEPQASVLDQSIGDDDQERTNVAVTFQVDPGRQYKFAGVQWTGNKAITVDACAL